MITGDLTLTSLGDGSDRLWRVEVPLSYLGITVPPGFVTDGATVPRLLWSLFPAWGRYSKAAVVHDHLCALLHDNRPHPLAPTRAGADRIFREAMRESGVSFVTRWVMWIGVRIGARFGHNPAPNQSYDTRDTP